MDISPLTRIQMAVHDAIAYANYGITNYRKPERRAAFALIRLMRRQRPMLQTPAEAYQLYVAARSAQKIPGSIAELGVYRGASARLIYFASGREKELHLFDTFGGLPKPGELDPTFRERQYGASLDDVRAYLSDCPNVHFHQGVFPNTAVPVSDTQFSFVHLDADLYQSTLDALRFFYPRLSRGGLILSHDYSAEGPRTAFDEFFADKPEPVLELAGDQCLISRAIGEAAGK